MPQPLVIQLRYARSEFLRAVKNVTDEEARKCFLPMNCIITMENYLEYRKY
jgi:hypothetical protein